MVAAFLPVLYCALFRDKSAQTQVARNKGLTTKLLDRIGLSQRGDRSPVKNSVGREANVGRFEEGQVSPSRRCIAARSSLEADVPGSLKPWLAIRQGGKLSRQAIRVDALGLWESPFSFCYSFGMAQERKSPQEKKQLEYTRSHFTFSNRSDRVFSKVWKRKKAHANRVVRRKGDDLLAQAKPGIGAEDAVELGEGITTSRIEKFKIPERLRKRGTVSVGEKVRLKLQRRKETVGRRTLSHENMTFWPLRLLRRSLPWKAMS